MTLQFDIKQIVKFIGVGGFASALYFIVANIINLYVNLNAIYSSVFAYSFAAVIAYLLHRNITFKSQERIGAQIAKFILATLIGLFLSLIIPIVLSHYPPILSFISVIIIVPICSFLLMKFFVFTK